MKYRDIRAGSFAAVELWVCAAVGILTAIIFIAPAFDGPPELAYAPNKRLFDVVNAPFNYYQHYLMPLLIRYCALFLAFVVLNFRLVPRLLDGERPRVQAAWIAATTLVVFAVVFFTNYYLKHYLFYSLRSEQAAVNSLAQLSFLYTFRLLLIFAGYTMLRYTGLRLFRHLRTGQWRPKYLSREMLILIPLYLIVGVFFFSVNAREVFFLWLFAVPCAFLMYWLGFQKWIPLALRRKRAFLFYLLPSALICFFLFVVVSFSLMALTDDEDMSFGVGAFNAFLQFLIVAPAVWMLARRRMKGKEELFALQSELGRSTANLDFLRSQINPHFLFNALNTIYGTAIQEGAERTSEGVEKLGDMMRFMLLENMQEKIALTRELEYLDNYISLQKLRTDMSPGIRIDVDVQKDISPLVQIAPMLLIPFVENAFKHGISLREESYIKLSLELKGATLFFDVFNSKHQRPQHDPEATNNGIGLVNVRQRLQLLYPNKHELVIRETAKDFFVHLILNLGK